MQSRTKPNLVVSLALLITATGCPLSYASKAIVVRPPTGTAYRSPQTVVVTADIDIAALQNSVARGLTVERVEFRLQGAPAGASELELRCTDFDPPYTCGWSIDFTDNGTHQWIVSAIAAGDTILGAAATELRVDIVPTRSLGGPGGGFVLGQEKACHNLGAVCQCAEPLNDDTGTSGQGGVPWRLDPADSEGAGTKECVGETGDGGVIEADGTGQFVVFPHPPPNLDSSITHAFEWRSAGTGGTQQDLFGTRFAAWTEGTVCVRAYMSYSNDYDTRLDDNHKGQQIDIGDGFQVFNAGLRVSQPNGTYTNAFGGLGEPNGYDHTVRFQDCRGAWCRFENCVDRSAASGVTTARSRITVISGPAAGKQSTTMPVTTTAVSQIDPTGRFVWIINGWRDGAGRAEQPGARYGSHGMQAYWPESNGDLWIGPAAEIEGCDALVHGGC